DPAAPDPWRELVGAVVAVAMAQGASRAAAVARGLLETDASPEGLGAELTAALGRAGILADSGGPAGAFLAAREAWRAVIRGLTDDFGAAAATTLDAWCETLLRALGVGAETKVDVRKALRREGVAAFGLRRVA
ncbi:MAG: hypothetical protein FJ104_09315, partial [Deltaproteobacteria bacterium]|nr:hypothetical protein [Deltaproteobacteria bacterium]